MTQRVNPGYKPYQKKRVVLWVANFDEMQKTKSGLYTGLDEDIINRISRLHEGIIVDMSSNSFEGEQWDCKPKVGDAVHFGGFTGTMYENNRDYYRIVEDKFIETPQV